MIVFVDMDGVLVDFEKTLSMAKYGVLNKWASQRIPRPEVDFARNNYKFWRDAIPMDGYMKLLETVKDVVGDYQILTSPLTVRDGIDMAVRYEHRFDFECISGKRAWIENHIPARLQPSKIIYHKEKYSYCAAGDVLIDDYDKNLRPWHSTGGTPIKYLSAADIPEVRATLEKLSREL